MALQISSCDQGNVILIDEELRSAASGLITFKGTGNEVIVGPGCTLRSAFLTLEGHCRIRIGRNCQLADIEVYAAEGSELDIGDDAAFTCRSRFLMHEPSSITIGARCLIASDTILMTSDMHAIHDMDSCERINPARAITIGDDVWLGGEVVVMKGGTIGAGSAIGFRSVVVGTIPPGCVAVGTPARVVREGIFWRHGLAPRADDLGRSLRRLVTAD